MDFSIIIVNFNTRELTLNCIKSVYRNKVNFEIILVDNNSSDITVEIVNKEFPQVITISNKENLGYSKANNQGMKMATGNYVLLLNSDTIVMEDTLQTMLVFMDNHPMVGAAGCKIILPDGSLDKACRRGFPTPSASFYYAFGISKLFPNVPRFNHYQLGYLDPDRDYPVDCLVGAFMMVRREVINQVGMLDEDFFMYGEDIDWCYRIKEAGWGIHYYPYTKIIHYKGASSRKKPFKILYEFHRAMLLFHRKHYQRKYSFFVNLMVYMGIAVKFGLALISNTIKKIQT